MAQITLNSTGVASSGALVLQSNGTTTAVTVSTGQVATLVNDAVVNGLTVGRGASAVATNTAVGASALAANTSGGSNTGIGYFALTALTSGADNTSVGRSSLSSNTTGSTNVAVGVQSLNSNTTASNNTAVGYQAGYTNTVGANFAYFGYQAGFASTGNAGTFLGYQAGLAATTGSSNTFVGAKAGEEVTTGSKNSILGRYNGNQGGLDIRTASNYIVLSDGDGNPRGIFDGSGNLLVGLTSGATGRINSTQSGTGACYFGQQTSATSAIGYQLQYSTAFNNTVNEAFYFADGTVRATIRSNGGIANFSANNVNLSDRREKTNFAPAKSYLDVICSIPVQTFNYIDQNLEEDGGLTLGVVAQDVQAVAPEMVMESNWGTQEEPKMRLSIYQTDLQYALMKAIQELKAEFDAYKATHP